MDEPALFGRPFQFDFLMGERLVAGLHINQRLALAADDRGTGHDDASERVTGNLQPADDRGTGRKRIGLDQKQEALPLRLRIGDRRGAEEFREERMVGSRERRDLAAVGRFFERLSERQIDAHQGLLQRNQRLDERLEIRLAASGGTERQRQPGVRGLQKNLVFAHRGFGSFESACRDVLVLRIERFQPLVFLGREFQSRPRGKLIDEERRKRRGIDHLPIAFDLRAELHHFDGRGLEADMLLRGAIDLQESLAICPVLDVRLLFVFGLGCFFAVLAMAQEGPRDGDADDQAGEEA